MTEVWELPLLNESLKEKIASASLYQPATRPSSPRKVTKQPKKDLYACLHRQPRYEHPRSKTKTKNNNSTLEPATSQNSLHAYRSKKHKKTINVQGTQDKPQGLLLAAFAELENFLKHNFEDSQSEETEEERQQLKRAMGRGSTLPLLRSSLAQFREKDKIFLDKAVSLLFHSLSAEVQLSVSPEQAIYHLARSEYFALKSELLKFASYCLCDQAMIHREKAELDEALLCLRKGLVMAIHSNEKEFINGMLERIGIYFYYIGNTPIGTYYHRLAERGLTPQESEIFKRQLNIQKYKTKLEAQLFGVKRYVRQVEQSDFEPHQDCSKIEKEEMERQSHEQTAMISKMLKDCKLRKIGNRLKGHMGNTMSLASIVTHSHSPNLPESSAQNLPFINVSHVLKSHLSRNRGISSNSREWQLQKLIELVRLVPE